MKKKAVGILMGVMLLSATGCSSQVQATNAQAEGNTTVAMESTPIEVTSSIPEIEAEEPVYLDYEDLFFADNYLKVGRERLEAVDTDSLEKTYERYALSDSTDLYNNEGTWVGYSKPDINVFLFGINEDWAEVSFSQTVLYIPKEEFDTIATVLETPETEEILLVEEIEQESTPIQEVTKTEKPVTSEPVVAEPASTEPVAQPEPVAESIPIVESEPVVVESDKYTPEEAVAVYRSIMEANGIQWDPSIKEFASWGTGFMPLDKDELENSGYASVSSHKMGGGDATHPWTRYYLEVTGYDENTVYITKWHCS